MAINMRMTLQHGGRRALSSATVALALVILMSGLGRPVAAQHVAVMVNGEPITTYDIEQRIKFTQLTTHKTPSRQEAIDDLINDKLKVQIGKRYKLEVSDSDVDSAFADMGRRMRMSPEQLTKALAQGGVDAATLKARIRADISWQQIVRGKFQSSLQIRDKDVIEKLESSKKEEKEGVGHEYVLRPILFVVPRGSPEAVVDARKREAEALRARFEGCETGLPFARALRDVAVRDQIVKTSADLPSALRKILDQTPIGKLTNLEVTAQGVELFALCAKRENKAADAAKREVRDEMFAEQFQAKAKRYLQDLRKGAMIEVK
jgi:peptidyl-prolyl cis-trans isomerase SurA